MIWPISEARAETQKYFRSFFGSNEDIQKSFWNYLTFRSGPTICFLYDDFDANLLKTQILTLFLWILGPLLPKRLGKHSMITIDEGKAVILGGYCPNDQQQQYDQNAIHLLTCSNQNCEFPYPPFELMMSAPRQDFVAIPLPEDAECTFKSTTETATDPDQTTKQPTAVYILGQEWCYF